MLAKCPHFLHFMHYMGFCFNLVGYTFILQIFSPSLMYALVVFASLSINVACATLCFIWHLYVGLIHLTLMIELLLNLLASFISLRWSLFSGSRVRGILGTSRGYCLGFIVTFLKNYVMKKYSTSWL